MSCFGKQTLFRRALDSIGNWFRIQRAKHRYRDCTVKNVPRFRAPLRFVKVVKVYDGDTITVVGTVGSERYLFSVRLAGIDTPEMKGATESERHLAKLAKNALSERIFNKIVELKNIKTEKYGRVLAEVWYRGKNMNTWMVENQFGVPYDGGKKIDWSLPIAKL